MYDVTLTHIFVDIVRGVRTYCLGVFSIVARGVSTNTYKLCNFHGFVVQCIIKQPKGKKCHCQII